MRGACVTVGLIGALVLTTAGNSIAQTIVATGSPTVFKITMKKFEVSSDGGASYTTVKAGDVEIDLAAADAGSLVGRFAREANIAAGDYNKGRVTVSCTMKLKGSLTHEGTTYYTTAAGGTSTDAADLAEGTITAPDQPPCSGGIIQEEEDMSLSLVAGVETTVTVSVDVTGALALYQFGPFLQLGPAAPTVSASHD